MSTIEESPHGLLGQLVQTALHPTGSSQHSIHFGESAEDVARLRRRLHLKLFSTLLGSLPGPLQHAQAKAAPAMGTHRIGAKEQLLMIVFRLREKRRFDEAQQLDMTLDRLAQIKDESPEQADLIDRLVEFLLALAGSKQSSHRHALGHQKLSLPSVMSRSSEDQAVLPQGAWFHGDGKHIHQRSEHRPFLHYDRELFEGRGFSHPGDDSGISEVSSNESQLDASIFEAEPGQDLRGNRLFAVKSIMGNSYERKTKESLFGGLVHSHVTRLDARLSLPSLPDTSNPAFLGIKIPNFRESPLSDDEGYHESMSGSVTSAFSTPEKENLWDAALHYRPSKHRTWENIGNHPRPTERPYLSEAGPTALDLVYDLRCKEASILQSSSARPQLTIITDQSRLIRHVWNVLIGLPSELFLLERESMTFSVNTTLCLTGTTPDSFHQLLSEFASAGTNYTRLWNVSRQPVKDSTYTGGLVLQAFLGAVRRYLQYYNAQVLLSQARLDETGVKGQGKRKEVTILRVKAIFSRLLEQLRYLARLCGCEARRGTKPGGPGDPLPIGIQLLSYLYQECLDCTGTDNYRLMLSMLRSSCAPYLMFIQDWVFNGICRDTYGEFMIQANHTYLFYRDKHYWTHGYVLMSGENESAVPLFLKELSSDIYVCGKSINLLKLCAPERFICNVTVDTPCIGLTFSTDELDHVTTRTKTYIKHMEVLAGQLTVSRRERARREEEAKMELLAVARRTASDEQQKYNEMVKEKRDAIDAKKRKEFLALKEQMQKDLLRRGQLEEDEKQADRERIDQVLRREQAVKDVEDDLERQAREEVIKLYADLARDATLREKRALWRIQRRQLDKQRIEFLKQDRESINRELEAPFEKSIAETRKDLSKVSQDEGKISEVNERSEEKRGRDDEQRSVPTLPGENERQKWTDAYVPDDLSGKSGVRNTAVKRTPDGLSEEGDGGVDDDDDGGEDNLEVGEGENEELEPVLALIRGSADEPVPKGRPATKRKGKKPKKGISISEFLPKDELQQDREDPLDSDDEKPRDTTVEDVLLEIGSALPSQDLTSGQGDGIVGLPQRTHLHGHPSDSSNQLVAKPSADDTASSHPPRRHDQGHVSDSSLKVGGDSVEKSGEAGDSVPLLGVPQRQHKHGHVTDASLQSFGSVTEDGVDESSKLVGVAHLSHQHGHVSKSSMDIDGKSLKDSETTGIPHRPHEHGHPSQSSLQDVLSTDVEHDKNKPQVKGVQEHSSLETRDDDKGADEEVDRLLRLPYQPHIDTSASESTMLDIKSESQWKEGRLEESKSAEAVVDSGYDTHQVDATQLSASLSSSGGSRIPGLPHRSALAPQRPTDEGVDALQGVPQRTHLHGHSSDSSVGELVVSTSSDGSRIPGLPHRSVLAPQRPDGGTDDLQGVPQRAHLHGHASDSTLSDVIHQVDATQSTASRIPGLAHRSVLAPQRPDGGTEELQGVPQRAHLHGHASDSTLSDVIHQVDATQSTASRIPGLPHRSALAPQRPDGGTDDLQGVPQRAHLHGHASDSTLSDVIHQVDATQSTASRIPGLPHRSALAPQRPDGGTDDLQGVPQRAHLHGHASDSTLGDVIHQVDGSRIPGLPHRSALAPQGPTSGGTDELQGVPHLAHLHGHATDSTLGGLMYPKASDASAKEGGKPVVSRVQHSHPSDSTVQRYLYPVKKKDAEDQTDSISQAVVLPVALWADEGSEITEFDFNMFEGLPNTDLLGRTGFEPLRSEIGDYGVHASQSDSIEATDLLPLPIIIKRSITAPLKAQVWLINQSILDYFLVDLRVDKHFVALRRFLFLQDGEFGQALCDQIFDKLAHCVHLQELLSPVTLNQILSRSIQLSASSDSQHADYLSFALKWHPSVFRPNAIDTLDCLELRYQVEWPNNVVVTDTCMSKYNKVFSFLLQLKRTGWVLRDIHHRLKISAMLHKANTSPQYHQMQIFRHEMQHFVNVMQGYVVNQVIHVSWEEFQKDLKENVHNLDDLREKHALYLNKAILRCLLNKKAAPVMKIICDILSLVLKVRTQLTTSAWAYDATAGQVIHPGFRNIKKSYMAFKEYSGFLYKVVAKLVTRGYQPHLEEFMLRLNFNDYYQEHKS